MPAAYLPLSCLKLLQKMLPQIPTRAASATGRKGNVIHPRTTGSTVVLVGHPEGTLPSHLIPPPSDLSLTFSL